MQLIHAKSRSFQSSVKLALALLTISLLIPVQIFALGSEPYFKRFETVRNSRGGIQMIVLKSGEEQFSLEDIINEIRRDLEVLQFTTQSEQNIALNMLEDDTGFDAALELAGNEEGWAARNKAYAQKALESLRKIDVNQIFENRKFKDVLKKFSDKMKQHLVGHKVMAHLDDPAYFYTRAVTHKAVNFGLDLAKKQLGEIPVLNVATFVIQRVQENIRNRRIFHQNMILYYLEKFSPEELKMTKEEVARTRSSIYESRIAWFAYPESKKARANWKYYGNDYFGFYQVMGDALLDSNKKRYSEIGERLCYAFQVVTEKGRKKIVNLVDRKFFLAPMPSDAYFFDDPKKIERQRRLYRLIQLGIRFVPMPNMVRSTLDGFIGSMYNAQEKTEGALAGYFESHGSTDDLQNVVRQTINPFLRKDFGLNREFDVWMQHD